MQGKRMVVVVCVVLFLAVPCASAAVAGTEAPFGEASVALLSQYIWRGQELSQDSLVIQPSLTVGYGAFAANLWGNLDTDSYAEDTNSFNETDLTLSFEHNVGVATLTAGYIYYALDAVDDSQEFFLGAALDTLFSPSVTVYREISHYPGWYISAALSKSLDLPRSMRLDIGMQVSYLHADDEGAYPEFDDQGRPEDDEFSNFHDGTLSLALNIPIGRYLSIAPQLSYTFPLSEDASDEMQARSVDGDDDQFFYGGVSMSFSF
jgi:hypothetical protein